MTGHISYRDIEQARSVIPRTLMLIGESRSASWAYRVEWPCKAMRSHGFVADWVMTNEASGALYALNAGRYNLIVAPRLHWDSLESGQVWIDAVRGYGCAWAYELDDDGWSSEIVQRQARLFENEWMKGEYQLEKERQERIAIINQADGVLVTTQGLADSARRFTDRPVWVVPNLIDTDWFQGRLDDTKRMIPPLTIGWSGGVRDEGDLSLIAQAWTRVAARYPQVKFVVHGITPKQLAMSIPGDQLVLLAWSDLPDYPRAMVNIDIGCCAVEEGPIFNLSKSPIKWMEYSMAGAATCVSKLVYADVVTHGCDGMVCETVDDWDAALSQLVENEEYRRSLVDNARQRVQENHSFLSQWPIWIETLAAVLADGAKA